MDRTYYRKMEALKVYIALPRIVLSVVALSLCCVPSCWATGKVTESAALSPIKISAADLTEAFGANQAAAKRRYDGKILMISGVVWEDKTFPDGTTGVMLWYADDYPLLCVECGFTPSHRGEIASLSPGDQIVVEGACEGDRHDNTVHVEPCTIVKVTPCVPIRITADELAEAYDENLVGANARFKGKCLIVTGAYKNSDDQGEYLGIMLDLGDKHPLTGVVCAFYTPHRAEISVLSPGDQVAVEGLCEGSSIGDTGLTKLMTYLCLGPCTFVDVKHH